LTPETEHHELGHYETMGVGIAVPIGTTGGTGQFPGHDEIVGARPVRS
jgi:hypothetical protein